MRLIHRALLLLACVALPAVARAADDYPNRTIQVIVPYAPGGLTDVTGRLFAEQLKADLGQPAVVENRPGASGTIGTNLVARAEPNGYTVLVTIGSHTIAPALMKSLPYDTARDLTAVAQIVSSPNILVVHPDHAIKSLADIVAGAKKDPGKLNYSTAGHGTTTHVMMAIFAHAAGINLTHVPYRGSAPSLEAVLGNQVSMSANVTNTALPQIQAGKLRPVAVAGAQRSSLLPNVPTFVEAGFSQVQADSWIGLFVPANTPKPIVDKLNGVVVKLLARPEIRERFLNQGAEPMHRGPAEFTAQVNEELARFKKLVDAIDLKLE
jgi:tripartite-type tricarboxylate transporter receptor subunit TctC